MSGEVTLDVALLRVESNTVKDRVEGLKDLKHILRSNSKYDTLSDLSFHRIYEVLFGVAISEKSAFLKGKTTTTRGAAENRLSSCASALRLAVEVGVRYVRLKTVRSVLDHVSDAFTVPNGGFCEPVALDYAKCLRFLLGYQPHVEHLSKDQREKAAKFCLDCIEIARAELEDDDGAFPDAGFVSTTSSRSHAKQSGNSQGSRALAKQIVEEMVACLALLMAAPNAAPGAHASSLLTSLNTLLRSGAMAGTARQDAFAAINRILAWTRTEDVHLTRKMTSPLVRLIKQHWSAKTSFDKALTAFRDEMLITLVYLRPYLFSAAHHEQDSSLRSELSGLLDVMTNEYGKRPERDQLRLEDIRLDLHGSSVATFGEISTPIFRLRCANGRAESAWTMVYMLSSVCHTLSNDDQDHALSEDSDGEDEINIRPRKRQRLTEQLDEVLAASTTGTASTRVCALQILTFLAQQRPFGVKRLIKVIDNLSVSSADDTPVVSSWAMLALASFASQTNSTSSPLSSHWLSVWQIATRAMSNTLTCRAACHLIRLMLEAHLVPQPNVLELVQTMTTSLDLNGPSAISDSVAHLLLLSIAKSQQINPASSNATAESILGWLFRSFRPSKFADREYAAQHVLLDPVDVTALLSGCLGHRGHDGTCPQFSVWDIVGQLVLECSQQQDLIAYLLLLPEPYTGALASVQAEDRAKASSHLSRSGCEAPVLNHLISEIHRAQDEWNQLVHDKPQTISLDVFTSLCRSCLIATCIAFCHSFRDARRQGQLQERVKDLLKAIADFLPNQHCTQDKVDSMLITFSSSCSGLLNNGRMVEHSRCEQYICQTISRGLANRAAAHRSLNGMNGADDEMDLEFADESQASRRSGSAVDAPEPKNDFAARFSTAALRATTATYAMAIKIKAGAEERGGSDTPSALIVDYILSLPESSIMLSHSVISSLSNLGIEITTEDCYRLMDFFAERILRAYVYERSEVALGAVLNIMSSCAATLTNESDKSLYDLGIDMYNWYTSIVLRAGVLSPAVQISVATLLLRLCHVNTDYGRDEGQDVPSVRTSLFKLVRLGSVSVKHFLAARISTIFGLFVLSNHARMFEDLQESLPQDPDCLEGIAMRLLFLAKLASAWPSLLRQCVYYIFETAGQVGEASDHASRNIAELAAALKFSSSRKLFQLFAPQLLHTWLQNNTVKNLPFAVFQYADLRSLLENNRSEITAQLLLQTKGTGLDVVVEALNTTTKSLVTSSFAKCAAYCIGQDITNITPGTNVATCENRLKSVIESKEEYRQLIDENFPSIMSQLYLSAQQEDPDDSWLQKREAFGAAAKLLAEMKAFSHSEKNVPTSQDPCFRSKLLCDEIERLCRRAHLDPTNAWDTSSFALAVRTVTDALDGALGSLQNCLVIRKLRLLVCMGGEVVFSGLPLEMLLHALRPFLADSQCADDVIGIVQVLFLHGEQYLQANPAFLYGIAILMVLQMRQHTLAIPDSTTQESQRKSTVQRMQKLQAWLVDYLKRHQPKGSSLQTDIHARITDTLISVHLPGNARKGSPESTLLLLLLAEENHDTIAERDRQQALLMLSKDFQVPLAVLDDCLESDDDCLRLAEPLINAVRVGGASRAFQTWAVNALGRAYAASGVRPLLVANDRRTANRSKPLTGIARSQATIAFRFSKNLYSIDRAEASLADYTLRRILTSFSNNEEAVEFQQMLPPAAVPALVGGTLGYEPSYFSPLPETGQSLRQALEVDPGTSVEQWAQRVGVILCSQAVDTAILSALTTALQHSPVLALEFLPCIVHILLAKQLEQDPQLRTELSTSITAHLNDDKDHVEKKQRFLIELLVYLRKQPLPGEHTHSDRLKWIEVDWLVASKAAQRCGMSTAALLFAESSSSPAQSSRRTSSRTSLSQTSITQVPKELLLSIFEAVEEPDSFYGVEQSHTLESVLDRLDYEKDGYGSLMFRSAQTDTHLRLSHELSTKDNTGMIRSLSMLNLDSLTFALLSSGRGREASSEELLRTARRLQQWDMMPPDGSNGPTSNTFSAFQQLSRTNDRQSALMTLQDVMNKHIEPLLNDSQTKTLSHEWFSTLASFTEIGEVISCTQESSLRGKWSQMLKRQSWMSQASYEHFQPLLSNRNTLFSVLAQNKALLGDMRVGLKECRLMETMTSLAISRLARDHGQLQEALSATSLCNSLVGDDLAVRADVAVKYETASVLWGLGEVAASINILQTIANLSEDEHQDILVGRSEILAQLGRQTADARLEKPDDILIKYLKPAISHLQDNRSGPEAGKAFYEFATFCDKQLQSPSLAEDINRITKMRQRKLDELQELQRVPGRGHRSDEESREHKRSIEKAKTWYDIDHTEYLRLKRSHDTFMQQSLQNYLLALAASDEHDISVLRFFTLWIEHADVVNANTTVSKLLPRVQSWKFVVLVNQLMSRLEQDGSVFQSSLKALVTRICSQHPHHSLHQLFSSTRRPTSKDQALVARYEVATEIRQQVRKESKTGEVMERIFQADNCYLALANKDMSGAHSRVAMKDVNEAYQIVKRVPTLHVPPPTMDVPLRADGDYADLPTIAKFGSVLSFMSGQSRPKRLTAYAANGQAYVQLFKGPPGKDDLRQDAIMEQVFGEVSKMLQNHKTTRQRNLHVRTYKVIPLSSQTGIIEFVPNSISLSDYLVPAHERYHPQDYKLSTARQKIEQARPHSVDTRVKEYQKVCDHLHPVLRHFFFERFKDPDEWFEKRTAYTRTTATISILGYVLGLGDRHCQNIMLDEKTGEVVHIDLGIAFEAGRVLPIPELVPFRLSRDVVDGMGITKTEGVFRRCCEFTMDALWQDKDSIMTLLNVLRYDPLYTWTVSPLRARRMQEEASRNVADATETGEGASARKKGQEAGEAERALSVVEKKLSKTLSTAATVNELIQRAADVRNLATLFGGWSAFY
ncbi:TOR2 phosphatidylinositol 3 and 4-kinase [Neohortaea acidophila]|uniref:Serine/threonine-protein kinase Tel1 n=1 Tax=Neohortaea acidophila TaxID=245834 RepID=A0A6A6Q1I0_9PEZI|nr:TOR2 phosphatidylinositol 3 and 4-kinase [Neohortaea acidophila]KAF2486338.1 TOR2 phosphatidylinositol 3 and 4-kinase [Neohortaea acidophila]